jgi:hypothetical protein
MCNAINLTGFSLINCAAHTIQLAIHDAIDNNSQLQIILAKCRAIVGHFKRSNIDKAKLIEMQGKLEIIKHKLIQEVKTRWNSTYYMLERILEQIQPVSYVVCTIDTLESLLNDDWKLVEAVIEVLAPFEWATRTLSGDKYSTLSLIIPLMANVLVKLRKIKSTHKEAESIRKELIKAVETRFDGLEKNKIVTNACLLDPRFKVSCFLKTENKIEAIKNLSDELSQVCLSTQIVNLEKEVESEPRNKRMKQDDDFWEFVAEQQEEQQDKNEESYISELNKYLSENVVEKGTDILKYWESNKSIYPRLFELSLKYLCIPATSCASERVFSKAGEIVSAKRASIKPKNVNNLIFLNHNHGKIN